jgi:hypothetical protein
MAGKITTNSVVLGDSLTDTQNFVLKTNADGTATLARGALGALGTVFGVNGSGALTGATLVTPALGAATATTLSAATTIGVGNATPSASGSGITFPATQSPSSDANTLDDYEEGTWTPTQGAGLTVVGAFSSSGTYTKIGNQVTLMGRIAGATSVALGTTNTFCSGIPFIIGGNRVLSFTAVPENASTGGVAQYAWSASLYAAAVMPATTAIAFSITYFV